MKYNKLVRDKIPEHITRKGEKCTTHVADDVEYWSKLKEKLSEEVDEFLQDENIEELADVLEVLDAMIVYKKFHKGKIAETQKEKAEKRGKFERRIILDEA